MRADRGGSAVPKKRVDRGGNGTQSGVGGGGSSGGEKDPRPPRAPYAAGGKVTVIVVPLPTSLSSLMSAPW